MIKIIISHNSKPIKTYQFNKESISLGRLATNDIPINSMAVSRNHLLIEDIADEHKVRVTDRESLNGTIFNKQKISTVEVQQPSYFSIGEFGIFIDIPAQAIAPAPQAQEAAAAPVAQDTPLVETVEPTAQINVEDTVNQMIFKSESSKSNDAIENEPVKKIDHSKAVLIELGKQIIYKINKSKMTFGNAKSNDIYIEGGVFSTDKIATLRVTEESYELIASNKLMGRFKVNGKKVSHCELKHKDKIEIGSSSFSFMLKEE